MSDSVSPSPRYSVSGSWLAFSNGRTASESMALRDVLKRFHPAAVSASMTAAPSTTDPARVGRAGAAGRVNTTGDSVGAGDTDCGAVSNDDPACTDASAAA